MSITIERFGKDHWSTFVYIETCIVDRKGIPDRIRLRVDSKLHPGHANAHDGGKYPTHLRFLGEGKGFEEVKNHDDISCLEDCEAAGLVVNIGTGVNPVYKLTDLGKVVAGELRAWKGDKKNFCDFIPSHITTKT